jgi:hypothetical protein
MMIVLNKRNQRVRLRLLRLLMARMPSSLACVLGLRLAFAPFSSFAQPLLQTSSRRY